MKLRFNTTGFVRRLWRTEVQLPLASASLIVLILVSNQIHVRALRSQRDKALTTAETASQLAREACDQSAKFSAVCQTLARQRDEALTNRQGSIDGVLSKLPGIGCSNATVFIISEHGAFWLVSRITNNHAKVFVQTNNPGSFVADGNGGGDPVRQIGILFQADMVRAILAGRKTITSRLRGLEDQNKCPGVWTYQGQVSDGDHRFKTGFGKPFTYHCPYGQPGDQLVGRETFYCDDYRFPAIPESDYGDSDWRLRMLYYRADGEDLCDQIPECDCSETKGCWHPSIHMPYWASRLLLTVVKVWPSRLQDMTEEMAMQEGVDWEARAAMARFTAKKLYAQLWDRINAKKGDKPRHRWASNPWVWRVRFAHEVDN